MAIQDFNAYVYEYNHFFSATSIKSQVCEVVQVIRTSLYQIHALFYCNNDSGENEFQGQQF